MISFSYERKFCPLCKVQLTPVPNWNKTELLGYDCPTYHQQPSSTSLKIHYFERIKENMSYCVIYPFKINNYFLAKKSIISIDNGKRFVFALECDLLPLDEESKMLRRLKTLVVFS